MHALFIGQTYIGVTFITDHMPTGDEKHVADAYAISFGGNAVTAAFCCAKLGIVPDLIATVANGGNIMRPEVVRELRTPEGTLVEKYGPALRGSFFISEGTLKLLREGLRAVVDSGTGRAAAVPGIPVAGKTGTADKLVNGRYSASQQNVSFVGFVPSQKPALAIIVMIDSPSAGPDTGGVVAAPIFQRIAVAGEGNLGEGRQQTACHNHWQALLEG